MQKSDLPEPWLRGTMTEVPAVQRAVLHALELAREDLERWCDGLSDEELHARPGGIAPVAFHLRHIARSIDRLLSYAEGRQLSAEQISAMKAEIDRKSTRLNSSHMSISYAVFCLKKKIYDDVSYEQT